MKLLNCQLQNVRIHGDLNLAFSPRLTLIGGPNEAGKSTVVEALHRALFLKASAAGAPVEALRSRLHLGAPTVQLAFEAKGDTWTLRKRFSGSSGQVSLHSEASGQQLTGPAAEDVLAELLGVGETLGSRQASNVLPTRWAHLWVMQGSAGDDLLEAGKASYDFDALLAQLEQSGGAAIQQSAHDQRVAQRIAAALEENFTSRGSKKNSPLWQREQALATAQSTMDQALALLDDYQGASDDLAAIADQLDQLKNNKLPALQAQQRLLTQGAEATTRLQAAIQLANQALDPIRLRYAAAQKSLQDLDALAGEITERQRRLTALEKTEAEAQIREQVLNASLQTSRESRSNLGAQRQSLEQRNQLVQTLLEQARSRDALTRLSTELEQLKQNVQKRRALEGQRAALPAVDKAALMQLRELQQQLRDARTRQQAMATGLRLLRSDQAVRINGEALQPGDQRQLAEVFALEVGDGVAIEITPGGGQALGDLEQQRQQAEQSLQALLGQLGVTGLEQAEQQAEERSLVDQQLAALGQDSSQGIPEREAELSSLQDQASQLTSELLALVDCRQQLEAEQPIPTAVADLQTLQQHVAQTFHHTSRALEKSEQDFELAQSGLEAFRLARINDASELKVVQGELADRQARLDSLHQSQGNRESLATLVDEEAQKKVAAEAQLQGLQDKLAGLGSGDRETQLASLQSQEEVMNQQIAQLIDSRGAAKQRCDTISNAEPFAAVEQARVQLEAAQADYQSIKRLTDAHKLLEELFLEAQADFSSRYSEPLAQSIGSYLRPLVPNGPVAQLTYDQGNGFSGLQLRRGQEFYDFQQLSGGMREQLAAALRLSMADVLKGGHDGCLPLVFDDAFTNSDPERITLVKQMLTTAVDRGLQVILLTCDPSAYGAFADQVVTLAGG